MKKAISKSHPMDNATGLFFLPVTHDASFFFVVAVIPGHDDRGMMGWLYECSPTLQCSFILTNCASSHGIKNQQRMVMITSYNLC